MINLKKALSKKSYKDYSKLNPVEKIIFKMGFLDGRSYELDRMSKELK
jgi:hypothetical protein